MKKLLFIIPIILIIIILLIFFIKSDYKLFNFGNNTSSKSVVDILNINQYEAISEIIIKSNKNENTYVVKQSYNKSSNIYIQEFLEPNNLLGVTYTFDGTNLKIENIKSGLSKIYENYQFMTQNKLSLNSFIEDYKDSDESKRYEENEEEILETKVKNGNKYSYYKKLYVDKKTGKPTKLEIQDMSQKTLIYILYNEIKIN